MEKITENIDLSKRVLDVDIDSPIFNKMRSSLNKQILNVINLVFNDEFKSGEISLKLEIELPTAYKTINAVDEETGEMVEREYKYKKPVFDHKITTTLKKQFKDEGGYTDERDIQLKDGTFIAVPFEKNQISIFDCEDIKVMGE